jgi:hypothetical protein
LPIHHTFDAITQQGLAKSYAHYHRESATPGKPSSFAIGSLVRTSLFSHHQGIDFPLVERILV